jgi:hypothetical protein
MQKYLQTTNCDAPKLFIEGIDFDLIFQGKLWKNKELKYYELENTKEKGLELTGYCTDDFVDFVCDISDCYQSRPLIEIDGFCEFDVIKWHDEFSTFRSREEELFCLDIECIFSDAVERPDCFQNFGSILASKNVKKCPKQYQQLLQIIKESKN